MAFENEQIVATVPTLELAEVIRWRLMKLGMTTRPRLTVYICYNSVVPNEYHVSVATEFQGRLPEDVILNLMINVDEFQKEQLDEAAKHYDLRPSDEDLQEIDNQNEQRESTMEFATD